MSHPHTYCTLAFCHCISNAFAIFMFVYIPMSSKTYSGPLCVVSCIWRKGFLYIARLFTPAATRRSSLSGEIFFVFQSIHYLNKRTLSRSNIIFAVRVSFSKSTCWVSRQSVFHKSQFCRFPVVALAGTSVKYLLVKKRTWVPFILKPAGNAPNALISQVAVFFELMAKSEWIQFQFAFYCLTST